MIQPSHLVPPSIGTGAVVAATPPKPELQQAHGNSKMTIRRHRSRQITWPTRIGVVSFKRHGIGQPSLEPLSP